MMPRDTERDEQAPGLAESRAYPRVKVHSLAYIELNEGNAGLILNISETGMAIQAVQTVSSNYFPRMHFRLPKTEALIQTSGKVVWQIKSKKEVGIEFDAVSEQTRDVIRKWIAEEDSRQSESEEIHQRSLEDLAKPESQGTAFQKYPSESGGEDMEVPVPLVASEPPTIDLPKTQANSGHGRSPAAGTPTPAPPRGPLPFPAAPRLVPDRWRPLETHTGLQRPGSSIQPERIFGNASWNRRATIPNLTPYKRPQWPYALVVILLAAVGLVGATTIDPGLIDVARIEDWVGRKTVWLKYTPPKNSNPAQQGNTTAANTAAAGSNNPPGSPTTAQAQAQPATQSPVPGATQGASPNTQSNSQSGAAPTDTQTSQATGDQANVPPSQPPAQTVDSSPSGASQSNSAATTNTPAQQSDASQSQLPTQSGALGGHEVPTRSIQNTVPSTNRRYANSRRAAPSGNQPSPYRSRPSSQPADSQNEAAGRQTRPDSEALQAWRAQTTLPASSNSAPNSTTSIRNPMPARQGSNQYQDAYSNSASFSPQPQAFIVDMSGYPNVPVAPSMPLSGVPSGSVAANSQLHAIWVPTNLEWAQHYLPGNLGVGRLLSSYSPAYPIEAARGGIQGTVSLDVMVATDGTVRSVRVLGGSPALARAAASAVRDWRYGQSFLAGQPIETEEYVSVVFRLAPGR